ncbi:hypothetical protein ACLOJK_021443 [Asimina triloba]
MDPNCENKSAQGRKPRRSKLGVEGSSRASGGRVSHGFRMEKGKMGHAMEDFIVVKHRKVGNTELGLYAIFDGHSGGDVADYLQSHLFGNILDEVNYSQLSTLAPEKAIKKAYRATNREVLEDVAWQGKGGSTAVTAILIDGEKLLVANVGDSRAIICKNGFERQRSPVGGPRAGQGAAEDREERGICDEAAR